MRTKLFIIIGLALAIVIFLVVVVTHKQASADLNVCPQFFTYIQKGDAQSSYKLFSKAAQSAQTASDWQKKVTDLHKAYGGVKPLASSNNKTPSTANGATLPTALTEQYRIYNGGYTYNALCYLTLSGSSYQINAFTSAPVTLGQ